MISNLINLFIIFTVLVNGEKRLLNDKHDVHIDGNGLGYTHSADNGDKTEVNVNGNGVGLTHSKNIMGQETTVKVQKDFGDGASASVDMQGKNYKVNVNAGTKNGEVTVGVRLEIKLKRKRDLIIGPIPTLPCYFDMFDTNKDGSVTAEEFEAQLVKRHYNDKLTLFKVMDDDSDGKVSKKEFMNVARQVASDLLFPECHKDQSVKRACCPDCIPGCTCCSAR